jgi:hypothetical protein
MRKILFTIGIVVMCGVAVAFASGIDVKPMGAPIDTVTFPDGTVVQSAYVGSRPAVDVVLVQIKQADGKICYGLTQQGTGGGASLQCF